jgi:hypothetical protein
LEFPLEEIIYNQAGKFSVSQQLGFNQNNPTAHELLTHDICNVFKSQEADTNLCLDLSESFCKVWREGLMLKLFSLNLLLGIVTQLLATYLRSPTIAYLIVLSVP